MPTTITPEAIIALALGLIENVIILVGLNLSDGQKGAISGLVTSTVLVAFLVYGAWFRHSQAKVEVARLNASVYAPSAMAKQVVS